MHPTLGMQAHAVVTQTVLLKQTPLFTYWHVFLPL